jgi:hypothetical protein
MILISLDFSHLGYSHKAGLLLIEGKKAIHMIYLLNKDDSLRMNNKKI